MIYLQLVILDFEADVEKAESRIELLFKRTRLTSDEVSPEEGKRVMRSR